MIINKINFRSLGQQRGAVLFTTLMFMIILTMLAVTSMSTNTLEEKMAANSQETNYSFQAAESALPVAWNDFWDSAENEFNNFMDVVINNFDGNQTSITYSASFQQSTDPQRCDASNPALCNEQGLTAENHYEVSSVSTTSTGLVTTIHAGGKILGPAND
tara:strand:- start:3610 stop:4089 length:480 start_codon:yes stop_codon:yes gene_type:complete